MEGGALAREHSLGVSRRARGEEDDGVALGVEIRDDALAVLDRLDGRRRLAKVGEVDCGHLGAAEVRRVLPAGDLAHAAGLERVGMLSEDDGTARVGEYDLGLGKLEAVDHRVGLNRRVDHNWHAAEDVDRDPCDGPLGRVPAHDANERALLDSP